MAQRTRSIVLTNSIEIKSNAHKMGETHGIFAMPPIESNMDHERKLNAIKNLRLNKGR